MTATNREPEKLDPAKGVVDGKSRFIYVLRFSGHNPIEVKDFCNQAQNVLYDDIGSSGHFRVAPLKPENLNAHSILWDDSMEYLPRDDKELFVAFLISEDITPINEELGIIPQELNEFCQRTGFAFEQMDVRELYQPH